MKKRAVFAVMTTVALLGTSINVALAESDTATISSIEQTIPKTMPSGTTITYDQNNQMIIKKPEIEAQANKYIVTSISEEEKMKLDAEEKEVLKKVEEERASLPVYHLSEPELPKPQPGMTVFYDGMGLPTIIIDAQGKTVGDIQPMWDKGVGTYVYGNNNKITISSDSVLGEGTVTWFDGVGKTGSDGTKLTEEDCATKQSIDIPPKGTEISVRNLEKNIVGTVYKYTVGTLPDAIVDIMPNKMSFYYKTPIGTYPYPYGSFNGRYYHTR